MDSLIHFEDVDHEDALVVIPNLQRIVARLVKPSEKIVVSHFSYVFNVNYVSIKPVLRLNYTVVSHVDALVSCS